jgi:hypothetical protein
VDNDGSVKLTDIDYIINYWGQDIKARQTTKDMSGQEIKSTYTFSPAQYHLISDINGLDYCLLRADTNGDGKISMQDINAVLLNLNSSHPYPDEISFCSESSISRESNYSLYLEIYNSLPPGELKNSIAREYGFDIIPYEFKIHSNYPNPFNPITTIYYEIPKEGNVTIDFINIRGQIIESINLKHKAGFYEYVWDANAFPSGIYFFNMIYNDKSKIYHKMMLIK